MSLRSIGTPSKSKETLYTDEDIILNQNGSINKNSARVKDGSISFNSNGSIDKTCKAYREGHLILKDDGNIDYVKMKIKIRLNPGKLSTEVLRNPYDQKKYRDEHEFQDGKEGFRDKMPPDKMPLQ